MTQSSGNANDAQVANPIVSHQFDMPGWSPDEQRQVDEAEILLWRVSK